MGALVAHVGAKAPITTPGAARRRKHRPALADADPALGTTAEGRHDGLGRRGFLATVAAASGVLTLTTIGQTLPGFRRLALLAPRDPADRPVNRSARNAGVVDTAASARLPAAGRRPRSPRRSRSPSTSCGRCRPGRPSCRSPASKGGASPPAGRACGCATCCDGRAPAEGGRGPRGVAGAAQPVPGLVREPRPGPRRRHAAGHPPRRRGALTRPWLPAAPDRPRPARRQPDEMGDPGGGP